MDSNYLLGVGLAILSGIFFHSGALLQKKVVNEIPKQARDKRFMRTLLKHPLWIGGLLMEFGAGAATFILAQSLIGPALVPGLVASGLIVLAIGSVKLNGEMLNRSEYLGIALMILGILFLGLSELGISTEIVREVLKFSDTVLRVVVFSVSLFALWVVTHLLALKRTRRKGMLIAFSNGFPFSLSNFWISPLLAVIFVVLGGNGSFAQVMLLVIASIILVGTNALGVRQTQEAFKIAQASNVIPVQQITVQITPILVYFYVFSLTPPTSLAGVYIIAGSLLIVVSGFLLGRRWAAPETISLEPARE